MKNLAKKVRHYHVVSALVVGGIAFAAFNFSGSNQPVFDNHANFVLLAKEKINLASDVTVSSGDIGINDSKGIFNAGSKNNLTSNIYAPRIVLGPESIVNGNAFFNKITKTNKAEILGEEKKTFQSPLVDFPIVAYFFTGNDVLKTNPGEEAVFSQGNFKSIQIAPNSKITLNPGVYNTESLIFGNNSVITFLGTTTINIKKSADIGNKVVFSPSNELPLESIKINSQGNEIRIGNGSITSGIITAPDATLILGSKTLHRGQLIAKHINIGKEGILSREESFEKESDPGKVVEGEGGVKFVVNEIIILFKDEATLNDAQEIAQLVNGVVAGFVPNPSIYKIRVLAETIFELDNFISMIKNSGKPAIIEVVPNYINQ